MKQLKRGLRHAVLAGAVVVTALAARADVPTAGVTIVQPTALEWSSVPQLTPDIKVARVLGNPAAAGPYALRVRFAPGSRILPHTHPDARLVTVLAGEYFLGIGARFEPAALQPLPIGTVILIPAGVAHYAMARNGEVIFQESGVGPSGAVYVNPADDPSHTEH